MTTAPDGVTRQSIVDARRPVILAGPGVVRTGHVDDLRDLAETGVIGVLNTWGAKGVVAWDSPFCLGTIGLQGRDFELAGLRDVDLIIATGLNRAESPDHRWQLAPWVELAPDHLHEAAGWFRTAPVPEQAAARSPGSISKPPLWSRIASVVQGCTAEPSVPLPPSLATRDLAEALGPDALVAADPGVAGFWVARTFPASTVGSVVVPAVAQPRGLAAAAALEARRSRPNRSVLLVADDPLDDATLDVLAEADGLGAGFGVEVWGDGGPTLGAEEHRQRLVDLARPHPLDAPRCRIERLAVDAGELDAMIAAAGPIIAWT